MNQHPNAWPDSPPPRRGLVQIEPHEQAHGTEGCADTSDEEPNQWPEGGFIACVLVAGCTALALLLAWLVGVL